MKNLKRLIDYDPIIDPADNEKYYPVQYIDIWGRSRIAYPINFFSSIGRFCLRWVKADGSCILMDDKLTAFNNYQNRLK